MSSTTGEPASHVEITEVQEGAADDSDKTTTVERILEVEQSLLEDSLFLITEHGRSIGKGAEAEVFQAQKPETGPPLALKIHKPDLPGTHPEKCWDRNVFNIIAPHVCSAVGYTKVHDGKGSVAWIMPRHLLNLRELIDSQRRKPPFPYATAVDLIVQLAIGLHALHERKIMHRDIRAANVLVTALASPKFHSIAIADFNGSKGVIGTGFWRAPEILALAGSTPIPKIPHTTACDVYSFAVTCYEILTGELPFRDTPRSNYSVVLSGNRPGPLPDHDITSLIQECWHQDPSLRPDATKILKCLRSILSNNPDLEAILWRLDLADIWSRDETDTPPPAELLKSLQDDLHLLRDQNETEAARLGEEFIALYESYVTEFGLVSVWKRRRVWEKIPAALGMVNKGNEFVKSLPDHGENTVKTLKTYSRLVKPILMVKFGFGPILQTFVRRYSDAWLAFVNANGGKETYRVMSEQLKAASEKFWASEFACQVRYYWRILKRWCGVREPSSQAQAHAQVQAQVQELLDKGLLNDNHKAS